MAWMAKYTNFFFEGHSHGVGEVSAYARRHHIELLVSLIPRLGRGRRRSDRHCLEILTKQATLPKNDDLVIYSSFGGGTKFPTGNKYFDNNVVC